MFFEDQACYNQLASSVMNMALKQAHSSAAVRGTSSCAGMILEINIG
jgi:hypothetical protein